VRAVAVVPRVEVKREGLRVVGKVVLEQLEPPRSIEVTISTTALDEEEAELLERRFKTICAWLASALLAALWL